MMKTCTKCGVEKPLDAFTPAKGYRFDVQPRCIKCMNAIYADWRKANPERFKETQARYRRKPGVREKINAKRRQTAAAKKGGCS